MRTFTLAAAIPLLALTGAAQAGVCPASNVIEDPAEFQWEFNSSLGYWYGTLEIGAVTFNDIGGENLTTRAYRQEGGTYSIPGPTMRMTPGELYVLTFKNSLLFEEPSPEHNVLKDPNITNIHTHGLHVSGETPADDVTRLINGGQCGDYVYEVPGNHMGGTLWYHAHHHGSTWLQVAGGAFGLLLIDDSADGIPAEVAGMTERQVAIGFLDPSVAGAGGDTLMDGTLSPTWTVNGLVEGNLCAPANEWQHWRVLLADADARMKTLSVGPSCEVALMARDGVWRTEAPVVLSSNEIELTGASRADLAVRCSDDSTISVNGTVVANVYATSDSPDTAVGPYDDGDAVAPPGPSWSATRPNYLRDLRNAPGPINFENINMGARSVGGSKFDADVPTFSATADAVQEYTIKGATNHPYHQHVYHFQPQKTCGDFEEGEYYDTIAANCDVRFDLDPATSSVYDGRTIMHCHILEHEDQGAMGWIDVVGGDGPPAFPDGDDRRILYNQNASGVCDVAASCTVTENPEVSCSDGNDNDCDGFIDAADSDCDLTCTPTEDPEVSCSDGVDNDCDGFTDGDDSDCAAPPADCSVYEDRDSCRADRSCRWSRKDGICLNK
jgi:FtsP/CotA-like multicopper oxidase with cupredoxin domain